jgi:hypothetical protein
MSNNITLKLEGDRINSEKLKNSVNSFYGFVDEIASQVFSRRKPINWIVKVKEGSIDLINEAEISRGLDQSMQDKVFSLIGDGIDILNKEARIPPNYNERALTYLQELASIPDIHRNGLERIDILIDKEIYSLSKHIAANVDALLGVKNKSFGSIEGILHTLSDRRGKIFVVYDSLNDKGIRCTIDDDEIMDKAVEAFGKRVYVYGVISYDKVGNPKNIKAEELRVFKDNKDLPTAMDVCGILGG